MDIFAETWESNDVCRDSNETFNGLAKEDKIYSGYYLTGIVVICIICFVGNGLIIHAILYYSYLRQVHNWFVLSLAVSDVIQGVTIPFYTLGHPSNVVILPGLRKSTCSCVCEILFEYNHKCMHGRQQERSEAESPLHSGI